VCGSPSFVHLCVWAAPFAHTCVLDGQLDADPAKLVSQMPIAWPYLGRSVRPLVSLLGENYKRYFPLVFGNSITEAQTNSNRIRLGVVAEYPGNTSPGHLIGAVVTSLANHFDIVFFKLATLDTEFSRAVEEVATEVSPSEASVRRGARSRSPVRWRNDAKRAELHVAL